MGIPKYPEVPILTEVQIKEMTEIAFYHDIDPMKCDVIFVFGGSHPGNWQTPLEAYRKGFGQQIIVTGGMSSWEMTHPDWQDKNRSESEFIVSKLIENGVPKNIIHYETKSTHSIANVVESIKVFDYEKISSLMFVCKSYATGRQYRTLTKYLPSNISFIPYVFDTSFDGEPIITKSNWMKREKSRSLVFGEYLRNICYGKWGGISPTDKEIKGLEQYVSHHLKLPRFVIQ